MKIWLIIWLVVEEYRKKEVGKEFRQAMLCSNSGYTYTILIFVNIIIKLSEQTAVFKSSARSAYLIVFWYDTTCYTYTFCIQRLYSTQKPKARHLLSVTWPTVANIYRTGRQRNVRTKKQQTSTQLCVRFHLISSLIASLILVTTTTQLSSYI